MPVDVDAYAVETGVPIPPRARAPDRKWARLLERLPVGGSFFALGLDTRQIRSRLGKVADPRIRFVTRSEHGGTRVWRVEDAP